MKIGFIGLGTMGNPMVKTLLKVGYEVLVYDISKEAVKKLVEKGAKEADISQIGKECDFVITMLPNSQCVEEIVIGEGGLIHSFISGKVLIDMSSSVPQSTVKIANSLKEKGIKMLDAPVSGGPLKAANGTLTIMVGGDKEVFDHSYDILSALGEKIFYIGKTGAGHMVKAINNMLYGTTLVATVEAVVLGAKAGIDLEKLVEVISASSGQCYAASKVKRVVFPRNFKPGFATKLLNKDLEIALGMARELNVPTIISSTAQQIYKIALNREGFAELDNTIIFKLLEEVVGVEVKPEILEEKKIYLQNQKV